MEETQNTESRDEALMLFEGIKLEIKGLALIYEKGGFTNLRCPQFDRDSSDVLTPNGHKLQLKITSGREGSVPKTVSQITIPVGSVVEINNTNIQTPGASNFTKLLNIAALHRPNPMQIKFASDVGNMSSLIKINGAELSGKTSRNFEKWEIVNHNAGNEIRRRDGSKDDTDVEVSGKVMFADFLNAQTVITIRSSRFTTRIDLKYRTDESPPQEIPHIIEISNLCDKDVENQDTFIECDRKSDFLLYYPMLDQTGLGKKFDFVLKRVAGSRAPCNVAYTDGDPEQ